MNTLQKIVGTCLVAGGICSLVACGEVDGSHPEIHFKGDISGDKVELVEYQNIVGTQNPNIVSYYRMELTVTAKDGIVYLFKDYNSDLVIDEVTVKNGGKSMTYGGNTELAIRSGGEELKRAQNLFTTYVSAISDTNKANIAKQNDEFLKGTKLERK